MQDVLPTEKQTLTSVSPFVKDREIAEFLGVHRLTVHRYMKEGRIPGEKLGSQWLCRRGIWEKYIQGEWEAAS